MNGARRRTRRGGRRHNRTDYRGMVARSPVRSSAGVAGEDGQGLRIVGPLYPIASPEGTVGRYTIQRVLGEANAERLHIETGSPIPTDEHKAASGCHVYGFGSRPAAIGA
ncbi:hypothetical protein M9H77_02946 [Catharanthus roseus]|uniref:Uncharacterized protein n=1 Tax=Catharanthus roseus TaxID=4058 RepID=A0ACC0CAC1_CATRO|nr:hypothetical protein M9H77_02946 [Catharanthus roseus]